MRWLRNRELFEVMRDRLSHAKMIQGSTDEFDQLVQRCWPQTAKYTVHVVQPGFDIVKIQDWHDESIRLMLLSLYDELRNDGVGLHVFCS